MEKEKKLPDFKEFGGLIKWPQCVVTGKSVTIEQAKEILSKTDSFLGGYYNGNNRVLNKKLYKIIGWDEDAGWEEHQKWLDEHSFRVNLEFLDNGWISNPYIGGVHGWCHPDGTIFDNQNIGKWPSWEEIYNDCETLATNFPYLDMRVYLFNQEHDCQEYYKEPKECVGGFEIKEGKVRLLDKTEFLDPKSPLCETESIEERTKTLAKEKKKIFGDKASTSFVVEGFRSVFGNTENFFTEEEFKEYFKDYFDMV